MNYNKEIESFMEEIRKAIEAGDIAKAEKIFMLYRLSECSV